MLCIFLTFPEEQKKLWSIEKLWSFFFNKEENDGSGESKKWKKGYNSSQAKGEDTGLWGDHTMKL